MNHEHIYQLIQLIDLQLTGTPSEIAKKLGVSERTVHNYLNFIQEVFFVPVNYNRLKQSYFFSQKGTINWRWRSSEYFFTDIEPIAHHRFEILRLLLIAISTEQTGPPSLLATHLNISVRSLYNQIDLLKGEFRVPIAYDKKRETYFFTRTGGLCFCWQQTT